MNAEPLFLVPTEMELEVLKQELPHLDFQLCGFGLITSGIVTCQLLNQYRPHHVYLTGIAGAYQPLESRSSATLQIGGAYVFRQVQHWGFGVGEGHDHQTAEDLGWHLPADLKTPLLLNVPEKLATGQTATELLSVVSASSDRQNTEWKQHRFPLAQAEDMEGFAVAVACALQSVPLTIIRGISNRVGDRRVDHWSWQPALSAAARLLHLILTSAAENRP